MAALRGDKSFRYLKQFFLVQDLDFHRHTALWSCTHIPNKYYLKNNYLTLRSKVKVPQRSLQYTTHRLMVMHPHTKYHWPISKDKNVIHMLRNPHIISKDMLFINTSGHYVSPSNEGRHIVYYLTLRSKVKVPWRSLRYATHRLMVMHPHTKYNLPIWKDKKVIHSVVSVFNYF
jgi:hypothetical protein